MSLSQLKLVFCVLEGALVQGDSVGDEGGETTNIDPVFGLLKTDRPIRVVNDPIKSEGIGDVGASPLFQNRLNRGDLELLVREEGLDEGLDVRLHIRWLRPARVGEIKPDEVWDEVPTQWFEQTTRSSSLCR